jgi:hypothetical protein
MSSPQFVPLARLPLSLHVAAPAAQVSAAV